MNINNVTFKNNLIFTRDLNTKELRLWDPFHSKVAAAIKKGISQLPIKKNSKILYLGAAEGYTISYISDIINNGFIIGVDISPYSMQKLFLLAKNRKNLVPLLSDANKPQNYKDLINFKVDIIIQDIAQKNQIEILKKNVDLFLKKEGYILLSLKVSAISQGNTKKIIDNELNKLKKDFLIIDKRRLEPFEKKHIFIIAKNR